MSTHNHPYSQHLAATPTLPAHEAACYHYPLESRLRVDYAIPTPLPPPPATLTTLRSNVYFPLAAIFSSVAIYK